MMTNDEAAIISYSGNNTVMNCGFTDKNSALSILSSHIYNNIGKSTLTPAFEKALYMANSSFADMTRIIILTNGNTQFTFEFETHDNVYVIDLGGYTESKALKNVAGGGYYNAVSAYDLAHYHGSEMYIPPEYQGEDTDGDGIPDFVEQYGLKPNGQPINSDPNLKDTDSDGLDDNVELGYSRDGWTSELNRDQYDGSIFVWSDPTLVDSDGDGLLDGKRQFYNNKVMLPIDPKPMTYTGEKGVWLAQKEQIESGNIATEYTSNFNDENTAMQMTSNEADELVNFLLEHKNLLVNETVINGFSKQFKESLSDESAASTGADFLDFNYDSMNIAYHSNKSNWQRKFGYNDVYDDVFEYGSNMNNNKLSFDYNGKEHILWSWKY